MHQQLLLALEVSEAWGGLELRTHRTYTTGVSRAVCSKALDDQAMSVVLDAHQRRTLQRFAGWLGTGWLHDPTTCS